MSAGSPVANHADGNGAVGAQRYDSQVEDTASCKQNGGQGHPHVVAQLDHDIVHEANDEAELELLQ